MLPQICNAKVAVKVGEPQTHCRITHSSLEEVRRAFGLPAYGLCPPFREPVIPPLPSLMILLMSTAQRAMMDEMLKNR
ncbi:hypothetical protein F444_21249 [Phytophthora nicotianae P1976]|uniref:Uncharacterized protein n=1 Tax=Phytophthora nicotianae P1976 TaxID=1317066 RepID=A0A080Z1S4_PHYNI|nr:hypothetical protein F444_21249 [Phytophthora nicotianae P1976]